MSESPPPVPVDPWATPTPGYGQPSGYRYAPSAAPGYAPEPGWPPADPGTNGLAIAGFVLALIGFLPLSLIFCIVALVQNRRTGQRGKGLAVTGLIVTCLYAFVATLAVSAYVSSRADRGPGGEIVGSGIIDLRDLQVGDCTIKPADTSKKIGSLTAVPCTQAHDDEVFALTQVPLVGSYPGETAVRTATETACNEKFLGYIGRAFSDSTLTVVYLYPSSKDWAAHDRSVACLVSDGKQTTGSLKGADR